VIFLWSLLNAAAALAALAVVFGLLERAYPAHPGQRLLRPEWLTDLAFFLGQYLVWSFLAISVLGSVQGALELRLQAGPVAGLRAAVAAQPLWLRAIQVVLLSDLCIYWGHRLQHHSAFLWRFHAVHHSAEHLDWLAAHREHPLDGLYTQTLVNLPAFLLGFPVDTLAGLAAFRGMWAIFIHSNVRMPLGPLAILLGAPQLHHWHHARERFAGNYANLSPLMDLLFGTYSCPTSEPATLGLSEPFPRSYLGQLLWPLLPRSGPSS
jgi:sterol desaturase/sphingolipid hydroxylase (fatty acid hydroxylase superfamily)